MFIEPGTAKQLADQRYRDMLTDARDHRLARQLDADPETARHRQPLTYRLWRRLRPVSRPHLEPQV